MPFGIGQGVVIDPTCNEGVQFVSEFGCSSASVAAGDLFEFVFEPFQALAGNTDTDPARSSVEAEA
jgi:hypothetical protein